MGPLSVARDLVIQICEKGNKNKQRSGADYLNIHSSILNVYAAEGQEAVFAGVMEG